MGNVFHPWIVFISNIITDGNNTEETDDHDQ